LRQVSYNMYLSFGITGVVFNEMKGVYSQPDNVLGRVSQQASFPDNTYGVDSGGDPTVIPNLTFQQFQVSSCFFVLD
jgi:Zn-dependent M16 (insulinase) family peptidase